MSTITSLLIASPSAAIFCVYYIHYNLNISMCLLSRTDHSAID